MTSILVTGGTGFLGSHLVRRLDADGFRVRCAGHSRTAPLGNAVSPPSGLDGHRTEHVEIDVCSLGDVVEAAAGQAVVIHCAAVSDPAAGGEELLRRVNVAGTRNVVEACRRTTVETLVHVSSTAAIGIPSRKLAPADESFEYNLDDPGFVYPSTKHAAERLVLDSDTGDLDRVVVNPGFMFGPHGRTYRGADVIDRVLDHTVVPCTSGGLSIVHVEDVVDGICRVLARGASGERYILSGENRSFREIAEIVCRAADVERFILPVPDPIRDAAGFVLDDLRGGKRGSFHPHLHGRSAHPYYSSEKARRELEYRPRSFEAIVAEYLQFMDIPSG